MSKKKPFVLRGNQSMMESLEKWASDEFRSVNGQIEWILQKALREAGRLKPPAPDGNENSGKSNNQSS